MREDRADNATEVNQWLHEESLTWCAEFRFLAAK